MAAAGAHTIVWRSKPEFEFMPNGKVSFYCRCHVLPYVALEGEKPEGCDPWPEA